MGVGKGHWEDDSKWIWEVKGRRGGEDIEVHGYSVWVDGLDYSSNM